MLHSFLWGDLPPSFRDLLPGPHNPSRIVASRAWLQRCCLTAARARTPRKESSQDRCWKVLTPAIIPICMHLSSWKAGDKGSRHPLTVGSSLSFFQVAVRLQSEPRQRETILPRSSSEFADVSVRTRAPQVFFFSPGLRQRSVDAGPSVCLSTLPFRNPRRVRAANAAS